MMSVQDRPARRDPLQWFNLRGRRGAGLWAFVAMRLSGIGLVVYLYLHLVILRQLAEGPAAWDQFVALAKSPAFLLLDVLLIAGILVHGLNGLRLTLISFGVGVAQQKTLLAGVVALTVVLTALSFYAIFFLKG
jgi:succinate dehydrogenase / fumarate reductase cytochrome b subunit